MNEQLDRIEEKLDRLLELLERPTATFTSGYPKAPHEQVRTVEPYGHPWQLYETSSNL